VLDLAPVKHSAALAPWCGGDSRSDIGRGGDSDTVTVCVLAHDLSSVMAAAQAVWMASAWCFTYVLLVSKAAHDCLGVCVGVVRCVPGLVTVATPTWSTCQLDLRPPHLIKPALSCTQVHRLCPDRLTDWLTG
jgi:hypothetical protein